jgi:hypothetical protein
VLRVVDPNNKVYENVQGQPSPFTVTATPGVPAALSKRSFRVFFPGQTLPGFYTVTLSPTIRDTRGNQLDTNLNAALGVLRGESTPTTVTPTYSDPAATPIPANGAATAFIDVPDGFLISDMRMSFNITHTNTPDLTATLTSPNGTTIVLFSGAGANGGDNFINTFLTDEFLIPNPDPNGTPEFIETTPIQDGTNPFNVGPYRPIQPFSTFAGEGSAGKWQLTITNKGGSAGSLAPFTPGSPAWSLFFDVPEPTNGRGEPNADRLTHTFRLFLADPTNPLSRQVWEAVGPASINDNFNSGSVTALAVDPADPSGNTVYVGGASGGVWKTTNFLTAGPRGPTWVPTTDFGPTTAMNIGSIAVFSRGVDSNQSLVYAGTGEGDTGTPGVGVLRSEDGGRTWAVFDSSNNVDANGVLLPYNSPSRDHIFVGTSIYKVAIDPKPTAGQDAIIYLAVSGTPANPNAGGIYRSLNSGRTWTRVFAGDATDVVLAADSAGTDNNLQKVYAAIRGQGVFLSNRQGDPNSFTLLTGNLGRNFVLDDSDPGPAGQPPVPVANPLSDPNGANGRIVLGVPALTGNDFQDLAYQGWLYVAVANTNGTFKGLYMTKDYGNNWTFVQMPIRQNPPPPTGPTYKRQFPPSNNENEPDTNSTMNSGNFNLSVVVDPLNPNVVYLGGAQNSAGPALIRVDTTGVNDPQKFVWRQDDNADGGVVTQNTKGAVLGTNPTVKTVDPATGALVGYTEFGLPPFRDFLNLFRDPIEPTLLPQTILTGGASNGFLNDGANIRNWEFFDEAFNNNPRVVTNTAGFLAPGSRFTTTDDGFFNHVPYEGVAGIHQLAAIRDPQTGGTRLLMGTDNGIFSSIDDGAGDINGGAGTMRVATGSRNGNLQLTQLFSGAVQPSSLAADVSGALFYGMGLRNGFVNSAGDLLTSGNVSWAGPIGDGAAVAVDQTGTGRVYRYKYPFSVDATVSDPQGVPTNFFQIQDPGQESLGRPNGLLQGDVPTVGAGQWKPQPALNPYTNLGIKEPDFAVNPINPSSIIMASTAGRIFQTTNGGVNWFQIAGTPLGSNIAQALAFAAPNPGETGNLDHFILAGTTSGLIFFNLNGTWSQTPALDGTPIQKIVASPIRGSAEVYAVTNKGVFFNPDVRNSGWQNITGNLFAITRQVFGQPGDTAAVLRYLTSLAVDWRFADPFAGKPPILYVAGEGGVFRSKDRGVTWTPFPNDDPIDPNNPNADGAPVDFGYLPNVHVTDLDLSIGNIDRATGFPRISTASSGLNMLVATTFGRGQFAIRVAPPPATSITPSIPGPRVVAVSPTTPIGNGGFSSFTVTFSGPVDPVTFTTADVVSLVGPNGAITPTDVIDITSVAPGTANPHNVYQITFPTQTADGVYTVVIGPNISDPAGNLMNQNNNSVNGEIPADQYSARFVINTTDNGRFLSGLYNEVLGRQGDTDGFIANITGLEGARFQILAQTAPVFVSGPENRSQTVNEYYVKYFGRNAVASELNYWVGVLNQGVPPSEIVITLITAFTYYDHVGASDTAYANALYNDLTGVPPTSAQFSGVLNALFTPRYNLASTLLHSIDYFKKLAAGWYVNLLGRPGSANEIGIVSSALQGGSTDEAQLQLFLTNPEYFSSNGNTPTGFVNAVFNDLFGRNPTSQELSTYVPQAGTASGRAAIAQNFLASTEYRTAKLKTPIAATNFLPYYPTFLNRQPSAAEVQNWLASFAAGTTNETVQGSLAATLEAYESTRAGATSLQALNNNYVNYLFNKVYGQPPSPGNLSGSLNQLGTDQNNVRASLGRTVATSTAYRSKYVKDSYQFFLNRQPSTAELNAGLSLLAQPAAPAGQPNREEQLLIQLTSSQEFFFRQIDTTTYSPLDGVHSNASWASAMYTFVLLRPADATGFNNILTSILGGYQGLRTTTATTFTSITEYRNRVANGPAANDTLNGVLGAPTANTWYGTGIYQTFLRRAPSATETTNLANALAAGATVENLLAEILGGNVYFGVAPLVPGTTGGAPSNSNFVQALYIQLFGRQGAASEINFWVGQLAAGATRRQVATSFINTDAFRDRLVGSVYRHYLGRAPSSTELTNGTTALRNGTREEVFIGQVLGTGDYFLRFHVFP